MKRIMVRDIAYGVICGVAGLCVYFGLVWPLGRSAAAVLAAFLAAAMAAVWLVRQPSIPGD